MSLWPKERERMPRVYLTMAMSLDGFITGRHDDAQNPAGINGMRLMDWLDGVETGGNTPGDYRPGDPAGQLVFDEAMSSGAVIAGRRTADFAGYWGRRSPRRRADLRPDP